MDLTSLGSHRMKDIQSRFIYQLGDRSFPPLKTIANTNLPAPASTFLGREEELVRPIGSSKTRLLTVTGPGGQGKTRFALELATRAREERFSDYRDGVFSCFFSSLRDPSSLATIARIPVRPSSRGTPFSSHLQGRRCSCCSTTSSTCWTAPRSCGSLSLLRLDAARHLPRAAACRGERPYDLPPLAEGEGVALFCERSRLQATDTIHALCQRLEGLPLAIELAAARTRILTPEQLLDRSPSASTCWGRSRRRSPPANAENHYRVVVRLLSAEEQQLFARLSLFSGGCTLEAAEKSATPIWTTCSRSSTRACCFTEGALLDAGDDAGVRRRTPRG